VRDSEWEVQKQSKLNDNLASSDNQVSFHLASDVSPGHKFLFPQINSSCSL
jgi:hypothetical protein